jgi:flavin-dependent dehydrogenase
MSDASLAKTPKASYDVVILGGGLAGLTLSLQLKRARPETSVFVAEKRVGPAPDAAFKVGESSVENGAHYYRHICGLQDHLETYQLRKAGLRFFFTAGDNTDIAKRVEYCTPIHPGTWSHQIDRGRFENEIADRCRAAGVDLFNGAFIDELEPGADGAPHAVTIVEGGPGGERTRIESRWLVDASGRAGLLKRKLGLAQPENHHDINASWIRLENGFDIEDWSDDQEWIERVPERDVRRYATIHLTGPGYWVWLIQLKTGPISIGLTSDPRFHPYEKVNTLEGLLEWFREFEPQLAATIDARPDEILDFLTIENFSYTVERVYSLDRWALTGEAGTFADPLYSPGSDFIAYGNTFIGDLVVRDLDGEDIQNRLEFFNFFFFQLFTPTLDLYRDQYQLLGNPQVMMSKQLFDNYVYFRTLAFLFIHGRTVRPEVMFKLVDVIVQRAIPLLNRIQGFFREWHELDQREWQGISVLTEKFTPEHEAQDRLEGEYSDDDEFEAIFKENMTKVEAAAVVMFHWGARLLPEQPGEDVPINPRAISLHPERWEEDGLFDAPGISLVEARKLTPGIEEFLLEERGATMAATH